MPKIILSLFIFLFYLVVFTTLSKAIFAIQITISPQPITRETQDITINVSDTSPLFIINPKTLYSYTAWNLAKDPNYCPLEETLYPIDDKNLTVNWKLSTDCRREIGTWAFQLWQGQGKKDKTSSSLIIPGYNFQIEQKGGGLPSIKSLQSPLSVGKNPTVILDDAKDGNTYTFWWDKDLISKERYKASSNGTFQIKINDTVSNPQNKKLCMDVGDYISLKDITCRFSTSFNFVSYVVPPPGSGGAGAVSASSAGQPCQIVLNGKAYDGIHTAIGCIPKEPEGIIKATLQLGIAVGGGVAFLIMLFGAFQLITSAGNPDTVKAGHDKIINAVIGLLFIVFSVLLLQIIGQNILGIGGFGP